MKLLIAALVVVGMQFSGFAVANSGIDKLIQLEKQVETAACDNSSVGTEVAYGTQWVCYGVDSCGKKWSGCGACRDHAEDKAVAKCEANTRDSGTCRVSFCERE